MIYHRVAAGLNIYYLTAHVHNTTCILVSLPTY